MAKQISEQDFFNLTLSRLPEVKRGEQRSLKKGENIWIIAKEKLGYNAKRSELLEYTYKVAKLNGFKSMEEMNCLKINETIFLPDLTSSQPQKAEPEKEITEKAKKQEIKSNQNSTKSVNSPVQQTTSIKSTNKVELPIFNWKDEGSFLFDNFTKQREIKIPFVPLDQHKQMAKKQSVSQTKSIKPLKPASEKTAVKNVDKTVQKPKPKTNAELSFNRVKSFLIGSENKDFYINKGSIGRNDDMYTIYIIDENTYLKKMVGMYQMDKNRNLMRVIFEGIEDEIPYKMDFTLDPTGTISKNGKNVIKLDKNEFKQIEKSLKQIMDSYKYIM